MPPFDGRFASDEPGARPLTRKGRGCFCSGFCSCSNEEFFRKREALEEILRSESPEHSGALLLFGADNC